MSLSLYAAYWLARRHFGPINDPTRPVDMALGAADRLALVDALVTDVGALQLQADQQSIGLDRAALIALAPAWSTMFDVRRDLLANAHKTAADPDSATRLAFGTFIVTRWLFRLVWRIDIVRVPLDRALPPNYDSAAKQTLETLLIQCVTSVGLLVTDQVALHKTVAKWDLVSDVTAPFTKYTSTY